MSIGRSVSLKSMTLVIVLSDMTSTVFLIESTQYRLFPTSSAQ